MKQVLFGFGFISVAGVPHVVSKYSYTKTQAQEVYRLARESEVGKYMEVMKDPKDPEKYLICVIAPSQAEGYHRSIEIVKEVGKTNAISKQQELEKELMGA